MKYLVTNHIGDFLEVEAKTIKAAKTEAFESNTEVFKWGINEVIKLPKIDKYTMKIINGMSHYDVVDFVKDATAYIKAVESGRILYDVTHVASSGMSRNIKIRSFEGNTKKGYYRNYNGFLEALGQTMVKNEFSTVRVSGCGMNMLFHTNYTIIRTLRAFGMLTAAKSAILEQRVN